MMVMIGSVSFFMVFINVLFYDFYGMLSVNLEMMVVIRIVVFVELKNLSLYMVLIGVLLVWRICWFINGMGGVKVNVFLAVFS